MACFRVSGEFLTNHFRGLVTENKWISAMNGLHQSLVDITMEQVILVLKGDAKLSGKNNDIYFETDDDTAYKKELSWMYSGIFMDTYGHYFKPYAFIKTIGYQDAFYAREKCLGIPNATSDFYLERIKFYMKNPHEDIACNPSNKATQYLGCQVAQILLGRCATPPLWIRSHKNIDDAVLEFLENRKIPEVGAESESDNFFKKDIKTARNTVYHHRDFLCDQDLEPYFEFGNDSDPKIDHNAEQDDERQQYEAFEFERQIDRLRNEIIETANSYVYGEKGWFFLDLKDGRSIRIPRPPFEQWALSKINVKNIAIPWEPISPSGLKMFGDDPYHTDWILGAGLDLNVMSNQYAHPGVYDQALHDAAWEKRFEIVSDKLNFAFLPLCGDKKFDGLCFIPDPTKDNPFADFSSQEIIILKNLDATHFALYRQIPDGVCVLAGNGGPGSHMVIANKKNICIGVVENIHLIATDSTRIIVDFKNGTLNIDDMF